MINEWKEFCAYTGTVSYIASKKSDTTWLGRFTFATILEFEGMARILTILARGYLFHSKDGAIISGDPHNRIDYARRALCAWCSVPEDGKRAPDKEWQFRTGFSELHTEFPELVDADGTGWFLHHVLRTALVGLMMMGASLIVWGRFYRCPKCGEHLGRGIRRTVF